MAAEQGNFMYTGGGREVIPANATHVTMHDSITEIEAFLFREHRNIVELICHDRVRTIGEESFYQCPRLKRVIIPGVKIIIRRAFHGCIALAYVECPKLERIGETAFASCKSLSSINLPSVKVVELAAFAYSGLADAKFGSDLETLEYCAFNSCRSLERITLPLKDGLNTFYSTFTVCSKLKLVDIVERAVLNNTIDALLMDEWRDDINVEVNSINQSLPNANPGWIDRHGVNHGEKARVIKQWIERVLEKIIDYKAEHRRILEEATSTLQLLLPCDIVLNNIVSFLELPPHTFDGEDDDSDESQYSSEDSDGSYGEME